MAAGMQPGDGKRDEQRLVVNCDLLPLLPALTDIAHEQCRCLGHQLA